MSTIYYNFYKSSSLFHGSLLGIMGTRFDMILVVGSLAKGIKVWEKLVAEMERLDQMLNKFSCDSEISQINLQAARTPVKVSQEMWLMLSKCKKYHQMTMGLFDITLKDYHLVSLDEKNRSISFSDTQISIDFGGFAKGYAIEKLKKILQDAGLTQFFINFGNSSVCGSGHHPHGDCWSVGVDNPFQTGQILGAVSLKDSCLSVSGNTPVHKNHIVHPLTGSFIDNKKIVCVTTSDAAVAEVLSTTLLLANEYEKPIIEKRFKEEEVDYILNEYDV